jgi:cellulose synthase/poly-beta-1,6-N-acetylglucosamine synthase-like glycosyltransferase
MSNGSSSEQGLIDGQMRALTNQMDLHDAYARQQSGEIKASLSDVLQALEVVHDDDPGSRQRLLELRTDPSYSVAFTVADPLVSVVIPTWNRVDTLLERAIPSALGQTHQNIEVIVVGDASPPEVGHAVEALDDPRVVFRNLTVRGPYSENDFRAWLASGTPGFNAGVRMARGLWIAPLGDDDAFVADHIERLLDRAQKSCLEFVYGRIRRNLPDAGQCLLGKFPPSLGQIGLQAAIYHAGLSFMELELGHAIFGKPNDWGLVHRMMRVGVRMGMVDEVSVDFWPSLRHLPQPSKDTPSQQLGDLVEEVELKEDSFQLQARVAELDQRVAEMDSRCENLAAHNAELIRNIEAIRRSRSWRLTAPLRRLLSRS